MLIMIAFVSRPHTNCVYWFCAAGAQLWENGKTVKYVEYHGNLNVLTFAVVVSHN